MTWRCEDRIKPLLDGLLAHKRLMTGDNNFRPTSKTITHWVSAATETANILAAYGIPEKKWPEWMRYGLRKHNNNMLAAGKDPTVKSTTSIDYTIEKFSLNMPSKKYEDFFEDIEDDVEEDYGIVCVTCHKVVVNYNDDGVCADCQMRGE